ncbi:YdcF family protein [Candidatus Woesearchaeota archaeon]|nr:YdcF family protein [Candidatus Woesearchaeota archaeon]
MKKINHEKIKEIYDYMISETVPLEKAEPTDLAFVFGRFDPKIAEKTAEAYKSGKIKRILITGGIGKDSGILAEYGISEADFQKSLLIYEHKIPENEIITEETAKNAGENSRKGIETILQKEIPHKSMIMIMHPLSAKRVYSVFKLEAEKKGFTSEIQQTTSDYAFDINNEQDVNELMTEMIKLYEWPKNDWCVKQKKIPSKLVDYAKNNLARG